MQKCYANQNDGGLCVQRQGKVLSKAEYNDIHSLPDKDVCRHKNGHECVFSNRPTVRHTQASAYMPGETPEDRELYVFDEKKDSKKSTTFDSFFD